MNGRPKFPTKSVAIMAGSICWIVLSFMQWGVKYLDISQLVFSMALGFGGMYLAYDQMYKYQQNERYQELITFVDAINNWKMKIQDKVMLEDRRK